MANCYYSARDLRTYRVTLSARLKRIPEGRKARQWLAFLNNHREVMAAFDFFTVPTLCFRTLYCFFAIEHHRRRIIARVAVVSRSLDIIDNPEDRGDRHIISSHRSP